MTRTLFPTLAQSRRGMLWLFGLIIAFAVGNLQAADEKFTSLEIGANTYSNATIINTSATHIFIAHDKGFASFRLSDLPPDLQKQVGYQPGPPPEETSKFAGLPNVAVDPRLVAMEDAVRKKVETAVNHMDRQMIIGIIVALFLCYLFFCFCCFHLCRRAEHEPGPLIWLPLLQFIPLFKAAKMSGWNLLLLLLLPPIGMIALIVWCFKICIARKKSAWLGLLLLLPVVNIITFLYLAFSDGGEGEESPVIKLQYS